jgi:negative regulator of sigma E activity
MTERPIHHADEVDDQRYREALRDAGRGVPDDSVDWEAFHTRLAARAELSLARLRYPHLAVEPQVDQPARLLPLRTTRWWEHAARWSRLTVSASVAAGIVLVMVVRMSPRDATDAAPESLVATNTEPVDGTRAAFESAVVGRTGAWTIDSALMPSAADLLIPLGTGGAAR